MPSAGQLVVGTAGHIDHGKSRLVWTLTGTNPDRLPEEQARGMTIELGFAHAVIDDCDVWFVDVPGHERFIRNMVAGATGVDMPLLVVAADDSIMPQTREHVELLSLLGFDDCVVVLTKMDLVDEEWAAAVEDDVRQVLEACGMQARAFVRTSAESGRGMDDLRQLLSSLARRSGDRAEVQPQPRVSHEAREAVDAKAIASAGAQQRAARWFRMPIDRAFTVAGRGVVVTGSVYHGSVSTDDELELWPSGRRVRVRGMQSHREGRAAAAGRMRLALNLAGISLEDVRRGHELATPDYLETTRCADVQLATLRMPGKLIKRVIHARLHIATSEVLAELRLSDEPASDTLRAVYGQIRTREPIVATWGQRFAIRDESGSRTLGGGRILRPVSRPWTSKRPANPSGLQALAVGRPKARAEEAIRAAEWRACSEAALAARAGLADATEAAALCRQLGVENRVVGLSGAGGTGAGNAGRIYVHTSLADAVGNALTERLTRFLSANPRLPGLARGEWLSWMPRACPQRVRVALADWLIQRGAVVLVGAHLVPKGHHAAMSQEDQSLYSSLLAELHAAAFQPPGLESFRCVDARNAKRARELIELAVARGEAVRIADGLWLSAANWEACVRNVVDALRDGAELTVAAARDRLRSTRQFVVPILERLDALGVTKRVGDARKLGPKAEAVLGGFGAA